MGLAVREYNCSFAVGFPGNRGPREDNAYLSLVEYFNLCCICCRLLPLILRAWPLHPAFRLA